MIFFFFLEFSSTCGNSRRISLSPVLLSPFSPAIVLPTFSRGKLLKRPVELYWLSLFSPKTELVFLSFSPLFVPSLLLILSCSLSLFFSLIQVERFSSTSRQFDEGGKEGKKEQRFIKKKKKKIQINCITHTGLSGTVLQFPWTVLPSVILSPMH